MMRLWNNTFHLEGKFIRTAWQLFIPGKVTVEFFKGKQERYPHPIRLFAIVMFLFLFLLNQMLKGNESGGNDSLFSFQANEKQGLEDSTSTETSISSYEKMRHYATLYDLYDDYEKMPADWKTPQARNAVDSLMKAFSKHNTLETKGLQDSLWTEPLDSIGFGMGLGGVQIAALDMVRYEPEEIIRRYNIQHWADRLLVRQSIKSYKSPEAFVHAAIGSLTWAILALVALMSGILALLYLRQKRYYVEHFIFLLHFHTGAMLLLLIALFGKQFGLWGEGIVGLAAFLPMPGFYLAMRRYYGQGRAKTFVKWLIYGFFYLLAFTLLFVGGMLVVFAFY